MSAKEALENGIKYVQSKQLFSFEHIKHLFPVLSLLALNMHFFGD